MFIEWFFGKFIVFYVYRRCQHSWIYFFYHFGAYQPRKDLVFKHFGVLDAFLVFYSAQ